MRRAKPFMLNFEQIFDQMMEARNAVMSRHKFEVIRENKYKRIASSSSSSGSSSVLSCNS